MAEPNLYNDARRFQFPQGPGSTEGNRFGMTGIPGANFGGTQTGGGATSSPSGSVGGSSNPLLPTFPSGQTVSVFPANTAGTTPTNLGAPGGAGTGGFANLGGFGGANKDGFMNAMKDAGFGKPLGELMWNFLQSGAGFNPAVAQSLINSMQPAVHRGEQDILEQFSAMGLRNSSPAAIGVADFLSQVNLNQQQIFAQLYEQAIQNYLGVLLAGKKDQAVPSLSGLGQLVGGIANAVSSIKGSITPTPPFNPTNFFGGG